MIKHLIASFFIIIIATAYSDADEIINKPDVSRVEKITLAVFKDLHPFCFQDDRGENKGVMIDIWKLWSEKTGIPIRFLPGASKELNAMILNGHADAHVGMIRSAERELLFDFVSSPVSRQSSSFFHHKSIFGIKTLQDLAGFKIGIVKGRYSEEFVRKNLPEATLALYPSMQELADAAKKGEIRVIIGLIENIRWMLRHRGILSEFEVNQVNPLFTDNLCSAVKKGNSDLARTIERGMAMITPEERAAVERKWIGESDAKPEDTLVIAMSSDYPPLFFINNQGEPAGMFPDIWRLWSQKTGQKIEFHPDTFSEAIDYLKTGKADIHIGLPRSREREAWMDFFDSVYESQIGVFFPIRHSRFSSIRELSAHRVGVVRGGIAEQFFQEQHPNISVIPYESLQQVIWAARDRKVHAFAAASVLADEMIFRLGLSGEFESIGESLFPTSYCPAIRKGNPELYALIRKGFDAISNKEMAEIESRWIQNPDKRYFSSQIRQIKLTDKEKEWIQQHPIVTFGISAGLVPFSFIGKDGKPDGMVMDYIELFKKKTGIGFNVELAKPWSDLILLLNGNAIDGVALAGRTTEREKYLLFTDNFISMTSVIITRNDFQGIALKLTDLDGKKVAVLQTSPSEELLRRYPNIISVPLRSVEQTLEAVSMGEADAACSTLASAGYFISEKGIMNLKVAGVIEERLKVGSGIRKDLSELVSILNKGIALITPEEHSLIEKKWIAIRYEKGVDWRIVYRWILLIVSISGSIVIITLASNRKLAKEIEIRRRTEEELREKTEELARFFTLTLDLLCVADTDGYFRSISASWEKSLGYDHDELNGKAFLEFVHPEDIEKTMAAISDLASGKNVVDFLNRYRCKDGTYRWIEWRASPYQNRLIYAAARDITERKQAEEERKKLESQLRQSQKMEAIGQLAGGVAHDFNNLLQVIIGYGDMMLAQLPPGELLHKNMNEMMKSAHRAAALVRQLLLFSRHDTVRAKRIDLTDLISNLMKMIRRVIGEHISLEIKPGFALRAVHADSGQIEQVLMNLCVNARDAMPDGGRIIIGTENVMIDDDYRRQHQWVKKGQYVLITVSDTGVGIAHEIQERIFEPFFTTKDVGRGTGLGLATVYGIVRAHQGMIHVYSEPGHGAAFKVYLPAIEGNPSGADHEKERKPLSVGKETILIAEDEDIVRDMMVHVLESSGYRVFSACNGEEAISLFEKRFSETELVILDVIMPKVSGQKVYEHIRKIRPDIAVIFMSGYTRDILKPEVFTDTGCRMIQKPCTPSVLLQTITDVLNARKEA